MNLLIIEDHRDLVANLYDYFEARGHSVDAAYTARAGLRFAREGHYDAVVLDLILPDLDGIEVCERLRRDGLEAPLLMLTARDTLENKLEGLAAGADDYVVKPFELRELEARLLALVRRARREHVSHPLRVADLELDPDTLRVQRGDCELTVPPIALKLLELLMRQTHRVVSREELEEAVWGDSPPDSDVLRAHMHVLRTAIDRPFERQLLHTIHGVGYRVADPDALRS